MDEKVRVLTPIEVPNLDRDVDTTTIWRELNSYVQSISCRMNLQDLGEWRLLISVCFRATNGIGVAKRSIRYPSDTEFEIGMSVSIPTEEQAHYGLAKVKGAFYFPVNEKYSYFMEPDYEKYDDLYNYILKSSMRAIDLAFTHGFTCNGKKIKFQK
jgi:hypothetical protein